MAGELTLNNRKQTEERTQTNKRKQDKTRKDDLTQSDSLTCEERYDTERHTKSIHEVTLHVAEGVLREEGQRVDLNPAPDLFHHICEHGWPLHVEGNDQERCDLEKGEKMRC